jgi:hypothetical protein
VNKYNFIEKNINIILHFKQVITFDWLYIINIIESLSWNVCISLNKLITLLFLSLIMYNASGTRPIKLNQLQKIYENDWNQRF